MGSTIRHRNKSEKNEDFKYVEQFGHIYLEDGSDIQCVVAAHPQGKPESDWVREVLSAFHS